MKSYDVRLQDSLLGLPCIQRSRSIQVEHPTQETEQQTVECPICGMDFLELTYEVNDKNVIGRIKDRFPDWEPHTGICAACFQHFQNV